ncbi:HD domain-containing protein [Elusimicrobiota bacterium]
MNRNKALSILFGRIKKKNLIKHMFAAEACMDKLALHFNRDRSSWAMAGLLHDLDYEDTIDDFAKHGSVTRELLKDKGGLQEEILDAIEAHVDNMNRRPETLMEKALFAVDPLTGLIVASVLMHPSKKIKEVSSEFVSKRFNEKRFAAGANREQISSCSEFGLELSEFIELCLNAMQGIHMELGL